MGPGLWLAWVAAHLLMTALSFGWAAIGGNTATINFGGWNVVNALYKTYGLEAHVGAEVGGLFLNPIFYYNFLTKLVSWNYLVFDSEVGLIAQGILVLLSVALVARTFAMKPALSVGLGLVGLAGAFLS